MEKIIKMFRPICNLITELETNKPVIHKVNMAFSNIISTLIEILPTSIFTKAETKAEERDIIKKVRERIADIHKAATLLDPSENAKVLYQN